MTEEISVERKMKQLKLRRKARRGEIAVRRFYKFVRFIIILAIFYLIYRLSIMHYWYFPSNIYNEPLGKHIEILGNKIVPSNRILSGMKKYKLPHKPLYMINISQMANEIEKLTPVKRVYIRRFWMPARLTIMVEEITPILTIAPSEDAPDIAAFAYTGELISRDYLPLSKDFKTARILSYGTKGDDYEKWDKEKILDLYKLSKKLEEYSGEKVLYIDLRNPHNAFAQLESVKLRLGEIDPSLFERIKAINPILPEIKQLDKKVKYIDLSWKDSKYIKLDNQQQHQVQMEENN